MIGLPCLLMKKLMWRLTMINYDYFKQSFEFIKGALEYRTVQTLTQLKNKHAALYFQFILEIREELAAYYKEDLIECADAFQELEVYQIALVRNSDVLATQLRLQDKLKAFCDYQVDDVAFQLFSQANAEEDVHTYRSIEDEHGVHGLFYGGA